MITGRIGGYARSFTKCADHPAIWNAYLVIARRLLLLTYSPRADVDLEEYQDWLGQVDNPFFNGLPTVKRYANFRIAAPVQDDEDFTQFDLLEIEGDGGPDSIFGDEMIAEFARDRVRMWGINPDPHAPDQIVNYRVSRCEPVAVPER
jgi:hypothetical protein